MCGVDAHSSILRRTTSSVLSLLLATVCQLSRASLTNFLYLIHEFMPGSLGVGAAKFYRLSVAELCCRAARGALLHQSLQMKSNLLAYANAKRLLHFTLPLASAAVCLDGEHFLARKLWEMFTGPRALCAQLCPANSIDEYLRSNVPKTKKNISCEFALAPGHAGYYAGVPPASFVPFGVKPARLGLASPGLAWPGQARPGQPGPGPGPGQLGL